jgi:hypothetical protein
LVSDIPAGDGKLVNLFLRCTPIFLSFGDAPLLNVNADDVTLLDECENKPDLDVYILRGCTTFRFLSCYTTFGRSLKCTASERLTT